VGGGRGSYTKVTCVLKEMYQNLALWAWARLTRIHFHSYEVPILRLEVIVFPVIFSDQTQQPSGTQGTEDNYGGVHFLDVNSLLKRYRAST